MRVKLCGMRDRADVDIAVAAGADALGFLVGLTHTSEDELAPAAAARLIRGLPPFVQPVLVTHRVEPGAIAELAGRLGVSAVQLHGELDPAAVPAVRRLLPTAMLIKAVHVTDGGAATHLLAQVREVARWVNAVLLDSRTRDRLGGTGRTHDWAVSARIVQASPVPVILAGGLTPRNVRAAVRQVRPYGVDANSGVEEPGGAKSAARCRGFVAEARAGD